MSVQEISDLTEKAYDPLLLMSVTVRQAGSDMIEQVGELTGLVRCRALTFRDYSDLRKAIKAASDALANFDAVPSDTRLTREQFERAVQAKDAA